LVGNQPPTPQQEQNKKTKTNKLFWDYGRSIAIV
jgi:hypothetical protein